MRRFFSVASKLVIASVWAHTLIVSEQAVAGDIDNKVPARNIVVSAENGLLSVDVGAVPIADVLRSIAEQTGAKLKIHGNPGVTVPLRANDMTLEDGIRRLLRGQASFGIVIKYKRPVADPGARVPTLIVVFVAPGSPAEGAWPSRSAEGGKVKAAAPQIPAEPEHARQTRFERLVEVHDLAQSGGPDAAESLAWLLSTSEDPKVRRSAAKALGKFGDNHVARTALIAALWDQDLRPRMAAIKSLARVGGDGAAQALAQILSETDDALSLQAAVSALGSLPGKYARTALERAGWDANPAVVEAAEAALARRDQRFER